MSVRQVSDWSGMVTAGSLPQEVRDRIALNSILVREVMRPRIRESRAGQVAGIPMHSYFSTGGQTALATANTLAIPGGRAPSFGPSMGPGPGSIDYGPGGRMGYDRSRFMEFARSIGVGIPRGVQETVDHFAKTPVTEIGPHAGLHANRGEGPIGVDMNFPHRPGYLRTL